MPASPPCLALNRNLLLQILASRHLADVARFLTNGAVDIADYNDALKLLHTESVASSKLSLSRIQRATLAQLRSGQCHLLNDYKVLTGRSHSALCPECLFRRHSVSHIFDCDAAPTDLTIRDLWINPVSVITFLVILPTFSSLVVAVPPLPPPPRPPSRGM